MARRPTRIKPKPLRAYMIPEDAPKANYSPNQPRDKKGRFIPYKNELVWMMWLYLALMAIISGLVFLYK